MDFNPNIVRQTIGHYRLTRRLGAGTMGMVFRATDVRTGNQVAVKILYSLFEPRRVVRFKNEVRILSTLNHRNIVRALSTTIRKCGRDFYYFPMELVDGPSLEQRLQHERRLPLHVAISIMRQVCEALDYAHDMDVIHRDLKPGNILLTRYNLVKVSDFGLARAIFGRMGAETFSVVGSRPYCSPRKWEDSSKATPATDLFSLGIILYRMLAGKLPFYARSEGGLRNLIERGKYPALSKVRPDMPGRISVLVDRLLRCDRKGQRGGVKRVRDILDEVYPSQNRGIEIFPKWRKLKRRISLLGRYPSWLEVLRAVRSRCRDLQCPDCKQKLTYNTYVHQDGRVVGLILRCPCSEHNLDLDS